MPYSKFIPNILQGVAEVPHTYTVQKYLPNNDKTFVAMVSSFI